MNRFTRATLAAVGTTAIGATAMLVGGLVESAANVSPFVLAAAADENGVEDTLARIVAEMTRDEDPEDWDRRYGDGT